MSTNNKKVILTSTPGPWRIEDQGTHFELLACDLSTHTDEWGIPIIVGKTYGPAAKANAQLLASAPELLDIVKRFIETAEDYLPDGEYHPSYSPEALLLSEARAVLANVEGRSC